MNKTYLAIIGILLIIALAVGGYAVYKTVNQPVEIQVAPPPPPPPAPQLPPEKKTEAPKNTMPLTVSAPKDGDVVTKASLIVSGKTSPSAEVTVNENDLKADKTGTFSTTVVLEEGENPILVFVTDENGNYAQWEGTIISNSPQ